MCAAITAYKNNKFYFNFESINSIYYINKLLTAFVMYIFYYHISKFIQNFIVEIIRN